MKKRRLWIRAAILFLLAAAVGFSLYANFTKGDVQKVEIGEKAPDFKLVDLNGEKHRLSDYEGQGVFLNFVSLAKKNFPILTINISNLKIMASKYWRSTSEKLNLPLINLLSDIISPFQL